MNVKAISGFCVFLQNTCAKYLWEVVIPKLITFTPISPNSSVLQPLAIVDLIILSQELYLKHKESLYETEAQLLCACTHTHKVPHRIIGD